MPNRERDPTDSAQNRRDAEAAGWVARHHLGTIDAAAFAAWRARDPRHAVAFCRALATWRLADHAAPLPVPAARRGPTRRAVLRGMGLAGGAAIVGAGGFATQALAWTSATTRVGENRRIRLPDGSLAELNTDSRLAWRFTAEARTLWIERGEIALLLNPGAPAILHDGARTVRLSQGRYNARLRRDALDLLILDGHARVDGAATSPPITAVPSRPRGLLVSSGETVVRGVDAEQVAGIIAWQANEILLQDMTLGSAVEEYNRFLPRKIVIVDRELAAIPVGGRFETTDPSAFLKAIALGLKIRVSPTPGAYLLTRRS